MYHWSCLAVIEAKSNSKLLGTGIQQAKEYAGSASSFEEWITKVKGADWDMPQDMLQTFNTVDLLGQGSKRVVFDVGGNKYRIICSYYFNKSIDTVTLFVKWIGTHDEYDKLNDQEK